MRGCSENLGTRRLSLGLALWRSAGSWHKQRLSLKHWRLRQKSQHCHLHSAGNDKPARKSQGKSCVSFSSARGWRTQSGTSSTSHLPFNLGHESLFSLNLTEWWPSWSPAFLAWLLGVLTISIFIKYFYILARTLLPDKRKKPWSWLSSELTDTFQAHLLIKW